MSPILFLRILSVEARKLMTYRVDFWLTAVASFVAELTVAYYLWRAIFDASASETIGGFSFDGMVSYYILAILIGKLVQGQAHALPVAQDIYEGSLTRYLVFPLPYVGYKYAEHLGTLVPRLIQVALFGGLAWIWLAREIDHAITLGSTARAVVVVALANLLAFAMRWPIQCVAFWADNVWSLNVMLRFINDFLGGLLLPLTLFPGAVAEVLSYTPFPYFFYFPVTVLLGQVTVEAWWRGLVVMLVWTVVVGAIGALVWRRGQKTYSGVGI